ncbi:hypothetical protein JCM3770_002301 [Rhodotorula araucariae]
MAKLTGTTPPPAPATLLNAGEALPTLDELQARARAKLAATAAGGGRLARSGTLSAAPFPPPVPPVDASLRRNNTVTGVGTTTLLAPDESPLPQGDERAAARVNLMRKLSARRLAGPTARARAPPGAALGALDVVGVIGRARPRSGSVSALDWRAGAQTPSEASVGSSGEGVRPPWELEEGLHRVSGVGLFATDARQEGFRGVPDQPPVVEGHNDMQATPRAAQGGHFAHPAAPAMAGEQTPRPPSPSPLHADGGGPAANAGVYRSGPSTSSTSSLSSAPSPTCSDGPPRPQRQHARPLATFGIAAVAGPDDGDGDDWARKRGSSASSSLAGVMEAATRRWRGSDAAQVLLPPPSRSAGSFSSASSPAGAGGGAAAIGLGVTTATLAPPVPMVPLEREPIEGGSGAKDALPAGEGAKKAFPHPDSGYQFPSPVASPRESQALDLETLGGEGTEGASQDPHLLFKQLAAKAAPTPGASAPARKPRDFPYTLSNYQPFSSSAHPSPSPVLPAPVSPTSVIPDPLASLAIPRTSPRTQPPASPPVSQGMTKSASTESVESASAASSYHSPVAMQRGLSGTGGDMFPSTPRVPALPASVHPSSRILAKLDSMLAASEASPVPGQDHGPSPLDSPPRKLLLHAPVLQVVNANTVKDRHLFLFTDMLLIAKPIVEDHPLTGEPIAPTLDSHFVVKSIVECRDVKLTAVEEPAEDGSPANKKRHPLLLAFVDRFANDPARAIAALVQKGGLANDGPTIANLLFRNMDLNRNQLGAYLANPNHRGVLRAYIERFRFAGVRIDDAVRLFVMSVRLPFDPHQAEYVLDVLASVWTESNGATGFDPALTLSLVMALLRLSDALHSGGEHDGRFFPTAQPVVPPSIDDFISSFRAADTRSVVPEDLLTRIYTSVRRERIEQASDNSIFSMTPDIDATMVPGKLPTRLTYRTPSDVFTISIPEPDPKFTIKLHGTDLQFDPPVLSFARSNTQSFRVTGMALGVRVMLLIKRGANAPRYQGLPLNKAFSIERGFMQHTFQVSFTNHLDVKRKYMFSCAFAGSRAQWLRLLRDRISASLHAQPPADPALVAARTAAVQTLRDVFLPPDEPAPLSAAAPSPRPNIAAPRFGQPVAPPTRTGRLGTPTRAGQALARSNSVSKLYPAQFRHEADLGAAGVAVKRANGAGAAAARDELEAARTVHGRFLKTGRELVLTAEQNSLLPLLLAFLNGGLEAAPHPLSLQGSAFQLAPLDGETTPSPLPSFVCGKVYSRSEYVRRHFIAKHTTSTLQLPCPSCDATFQRPDLVVRHIKLYHPGLTPDVSPPPPGDEDSPEPPARVEVPVPVKCPPGTELPPRRRGRPLKKRPVDEEADEEPVLADEEDASQRAEEELRQEEDAAAAAVLLEASGQSATLELSSLPASVAATQSPSYALPTPPPLLFMNEQSDSASSVPSAAAHAALQPSVASISYAPPTPATSYVPYISTLCDPPAEILPAKRARSASSPSSSHSLNALADTTQERLAHFLHSGTIATAGHSLFPNHFAPAPEVTQQPVGDAVTRLADVPPMQAATVLALSALRPRNFAVEALLGNEDDWTERDDEGRVIEGETSEFVRVLEVVTGAATRREPSMYPGLDHLWSTERGHGSRFFMPSQRFCIAYLFPWEIPPLPKLSRYAAQTYSSLLPILPILHRPTLVMTSIAPPLAFALSVVGAGFFQSSKKFFEEMTHIKRDFAADALTDVVLHADERVPAAQTLLLYQLVGCFSDSQAERDYSLRHHPLLIQTFLDMVSPVCTVPPDLDLPAKDLERVWQSWVAQETHIRIAFLCYLLDVEVGRLTGDDQRLLPHSHPALSNLPLPSSETLWNADSAPAWREAWVRLAHLQGRSPASYSTTRSPPTFKSALNALLSATPPSPTSAAARTLSALPHVAPLAITTLYQTLASLRTQIAVSQRLLRNLAAAPPTSIAPAQLLPGSGAAQGAGGLVEAATASAKESQERIAFGLKVLRMLGGSAASDKWFAGVEAIFR